jgi:hypothetical protein
MYIYMYTKYTCIYTYKDSCSPTVRDASAQLLDLIIAQNQPGDGLGMRKEERGVILEPLGVYESWNTAAVCVDLVYTVEVAQHAKPLLKISESAVLKEPRMHNAESIQQLTLWKATLQLSNDSLGSCCQAHLHRLPCSYRESHSLQDAHKHTKSVSH